MKKRTFWSLLSSLDSLKLQHCTQLLPFFVVHFWRSSLGFEEFACVVFLQRSEMALLLTTVTLQLVSEYILYYILIMIWELWVKSTFFGLRGIINCILLLRRLGTSVSAQQQLSIILTRTWFKVNKTFCKTNASTFMSGLNLSDLAICMVAVACCSISHKKGAV